MATPSDFEAVVGATEEKWNNPPIRNEMFGNILRSVSIASVRGLAVTVEFSWPVTIIGGVNGTGKTTILQVCSTAYVKEKTRRYFKLGDWIRNALVGESPPIGNPAKVTFRFWDDTPELAVPYLPAKTRWGYPRRGNPTRRVEFIGISEFAPRIERRDRVHAYRAHLTIKDSTKLDAHIVEKLCAVMGNPYTSATINTVGTEAGTWSDDLPQLSRGGAVYGEPHMGAGEQKIVRLVNRLEALPRNSLIVLEEPETTLHPDSQRGLAWYLMSLAIRKGHQIIVATHSTEMFEAMPAVGRVLLLRTPGELQVVHRAPSLVAARELAGSVNSNRDLVLVEDKVAKRFLTELIRQFNHKLLSQVTIVPIGSKDDVRRITRSLREQGYRAIGVRDGDVGEDAGNGVLSLPGGMSPEKLLLQEENVRGTADLLDGAAAAYEMAKARVAAPEEARRFKELLTHFAEELDIDIDLATDRLTLTWQQTHEEEARTFVDKLSEAFG